MPDACLLLGTNLGDRENNLRRARELLAEHAGRPGPLSNIYETEPWGFVDQPWFLNQAISIETELSPEGLMQAILNIEQKMGRVRFRKWHQRLIDIDILFYEDRVVHQENLHIPHPHLHERLFVLAPLVEIAPGFHHPQMGKTVRELFQACDDDLSAKLFKLVDP